jgi:type I restriction enzyme S subunit
VSWPTFKLGEIFEIARGGSPRPIDSHLTEDASGMPWIMIADVPPGAKYVEKTRKRIKQSSVEKSRNREGWVAGSVKRWPD